jgi:hypothetical protein
MEGVVLEVALNPGGSAQLQLFLAFNEAMVEIIDTYGEIYNKAKYVKSDLEAMKNYASEILIFLKKVEQNTKYIFKNEKSQFNQDKFLKLLDNPYSALYSEASATNNRIQSWIENIKTNHGGVITTQKYLDHYTEIYSQLFTNQFIFLKAHLTCYDNKTQRQLNRKFEGGLKNFEFNLTATDVLSSIKPEVFENSKCKLTSTKNNQKNIKNKPANNSQSRNASRKINGKNNTTTISSRKSPVSSYVENLGQNNVPETKSAPEKVNNPAESVEAKENLQASLLNQTPVAQNDEEKVYSEKSNIVLSLDQNETEATHLDDVSLLNPFPLSEQVDSLILSQELSELKEQEKIYIETKETKQTISKFQECAAEMKELNNVLNEFDGGPAAGMKTRKFLKLCEALNKLGYFSEFSANEKEVKIKTNNMVTVMHTNHSGNKKSPGITNNTANKLKEVIEVIQKK